MRNSLLIAILWFSLSASAQSGLTVDWAWKLSHRCNDTSTLLKISGIPEGTSRFAVQMSDLNFRNKGHGGGKVPQPGGASTEIPERVLQSSYLGLRPNNFSSFGHSYQITLRALNAQGNETGQSG